MGAGITAREIWNNLEDRVIVTLDDQGCTWVWDRDRKDFVMYEMAMPNLAEVWRRRFADLVAAFDPVREKRDAEPIDDLVFQVGDF